jgi:hypothetical protein
VNELTIFAIDPGSKESGVVLWSETRKRVITSEHANNLKVLSYLRDLSVEIIVSIEQIRGYGIVAGDDTFDTCEWSGRFREAHEEKLGGVVHMIPRKDVKRHLCGNTTTNDKYIRQALIDRFGETGTKKYPGPLYGISGHLWAALAVAVTCAETKLQ